MIRFIQLSDLHIHGSNKNDDNVNAVKVVEYIIARYANFKKGQKPVLLITGDITDDGKKNQYRNAVNILKPLVKSGFEVLPCPGNHDYGPCGNLYTARSQKLFQEYILGELVEIKKAGDQAVTMEDLYPLVKDVANVLFIGLDSVVGNDDDLVHFASGEVGVHQRNKLDAILRKPAHAGKKIVVYFHHHPFYRSFIKKIFLELDDAKEVMNMLGRRTDYVCFGHKHDSDIWTGQHGIDWIMASGKTSERNDLYKFQFREVTIDGDDNNVAMVTFKKD